jgi:hypothetical protein
MDTDQGGYGLFGESTLLAHVSETCNVEFYLKDPTFLKMYPKTGQTGFTGHCVEMLTEGGWRFVGSHINDFGRLESTFERRK